MRTPIPSDLVLSHPAVMALLLAVILGGCADTKIPRFLFNDGPPAPTAAKNDAPWPNLASVPPRPNAEVPSPLELQQRADIMAADQAESIRQAAQLQAKPVSTQSAPSAPPAGTAAPVVPDAPPTAPSSAPSPSP